MKHRIIQLMGVTAVVAGFFLVTAGSVFAGSATVSWNANSETDLAGYVVHYGTNSSASCPSGYANHATTTGTSMTLNGLTDGQTYYFQVTAYDTSNNVSACSSQVSKLVADATPPVTTASPLGGSFSSGQTVTLTADETATIYYTLDGSTPGIGSTQYSGAISIPTTKTLKYFAKDTAGNIEGVKTQLYTISIPDVTAPVTTAAPLGGSFSSAQSVTLTADETATIYYTLNGSTPTTGSTQYSGPISIATNGTTTLKYFAKDTANNSEVVKTQTYVLSIATPDVASPTTPSGVSANAVSSTQIDLAWTASSDNTAVAGYKIYRHNVQIATTTATSYFDTGLVAGTNYRYTITAFDATGNVSSASSEVSATTQVVVVSSGGGGGGGGGGGSSYYTPVTTTTGGGSTTATTTQTTGTSTTVPTQPVVTGTAPTGEYAQFGTYITKKHLVLGSKNADVKKLQEFLKLDGYLKEEPTGYYGKATKVAVQTFQREHNIAGPGTEGYGEIGGKTRAVLNQHLTGSVAGGGATTNSNANIEALKKQIEILQQKVLELLKQLAAMKK